MLLTDIESYSASRIVLEVEKLTKSFLCSKNISYFQFKRTYKNKTSITLANNHVFFEEFYEKAFVGSSINSDFYTFQSSIYFWDESLPNDKLMKIRQEMGIFHGFTILSRHKSYFDCISFAMSKLHHAPYAYYFHILKELQQFGEHFPTIAFQLIKNTPRITMKNIGIYQDASNKCFFLPNKSVRLKVGKDIDKYITTYEALCVQLVKEGKSHKEIGNILSITSNTVKTHLNRLKARTGLSVREISIHPFQAYVSEIKK
jgi:DNA-binding CsgD family transcriptional regulator